MELKNLLALGKNYLISPERKYLIPLIAIILIGAVLRFYNLNWGDGFFFHPDERNIAFAVTNLDFDNSQFNPKFWAYGSLPVYFIYLTAWITSHLFNSDTMNFENYIIIGRFISALCSTLIMPITFYITRQILIGVKSREFIALIAAFWIAFLPGMIQFAHFTTFETFLTLQYLLALIFAARVANNPTRGNYLWLGIILGLSLGTKITSVIVLPLLPLAHWISQYNQNRHLTLKNLISQVFDVRLISAFILISIVAVLVSPFHILDWGGHINSFNYESAVANGNLIVFYTQQFIDTIPGLYQLTKVFPYILTIPLSLLSLIAFLHLTYQTIKAAYSRIRQSQPLSAYNIWLILLITMTALYLGFHFTMYVKWTRYMIPSLPLLIILSAVYIFHTGKNLRARFINNNRKPDEVITKTVILLTTLWVVMSGVTFWQIYVTNPSDIYHDNRVKAAEWAGKNLPAKSTIATEPYDLGTMAFNRIFPSSSIMLIPIYDLEDSAHPEANLKQLQQSDYFISLSQRVFATGFRLPEKYPIRNQLYQEIFTDTSKWELMARFSSQPIDCSFWTFYCLGGKFTPDETFTVFDHPTLLIYKNLPRD